MDELNKIRVASAEAAARLEKLKQENARLVANVTGKLAQLQALRIASTEIINK